MRGKKGGLDDFKLYYEDLPNVSESEKKAFGSKIRILHKSFLDNRHIVRFSNFVRYHLQHFRQWLSTDGTDLPANVDGGGLHMPKVSQTNPKRGRKKKG